MRKYEYDNFFREKKEKYFALRAKLGKKRQGASRPREDKEREYLILQDKKRWEKWLKSGKLKEIAPRYWRFTLKGSP